MDLILVILIGIVEAALVVGVMSLFVARNRGVDKNATQAIDEELSKKRSIHEKLKELYASMVDAGAILEKGRQLKVLKDSLKAERGRIAITQAELETVEARLRELEEIERELEASGIETKEEINILQKKEKEYKTKNEQLTVQSADLIGRMAQLMSSVTMPPDITEQFNAMKNDLSMTGEKAALLLTQIEQGNQEYFSLKKRYDALDIEYAQLYEKFSESQAKAGG